MLIEDRRSMHIWRTNCIAGPQPMIPSLLAISDKHVRYDLKPILQRIVNLQTISKLQAKHAVIEPSNIRYTKWSMLIPPNSWATCLSSALNWSNASIFSFDRLGSPLFFLLSLILTLCKSSTTTNSFGCDERCDPLDTRSGSTGVGYKKSKSL